MHTFSMKNTVTVTLSDRPSLVFVLEIQADTHYTVIGCEN